MGQKTAKANELFFVVDENDQPLEPLPRRLVHGHGVWHRVSHVWLYNDKGQVLCQQRSFAKELNPGLWEAFFGGHIRPDEEYIDGAIREMREELSINLAVADLKLWKVYKFDDPKSYNNEFQAVFVVRWNGEASQFALDDGEVEQVVWKDIADVRQGVTGKTTEKWTNCGYELELCQYLKTLT